MRSPIHNLQDLSFSSSSFRCLRNGDFHFIPLHGTAHILFTDKNILRLSFHRHKSESSCVRLKDSAQMLRFPFDIFPFLSDMNLAFCLQRIHYCLQFISLIFWHLQQHRKFFQLHRHIELVTDKFIYDFLPLFKYLVHFLSPCFTPSGLCIEKRTPYNYYRVFLIFNHSFVNQILSDSALLQVR